MRRIVYRMAGGSIYGARTQAFKLPQQIQARTYIAPDKTRVLAISEGLWDLQKESTFTNIAAMLTVDAACSMFDEIEFEQLYKQDDDELKIHLIYPIEKKLDEFAKYINTSRKYNLDASLLLLAINRGRYIWLDSSAGFIYSINTSESGTSKFTFDKVFTQRDPIVNPCSVRLEYADHRISAGKGKVPTDILGYVLLSPKMKLCDPLGELPDEYGDGIISDCVDKVLTYGQESESSAIIRSIMRNRFPRIRTDDDVAMLIYTQIESEWLLRGEEEQELTCEVFDAAQDENGTDLNHDCFMNPVFNHDQDEVELKEFYHNCFRTPELDKE